MKIHPPKKLYVSESKIKNAGRGVFASEDLAKDEIIEICPLLEMPVDDVFALTDSLLATYYFSFTDSADKVAIALGFGSIYNHSYDPNATYKKISAEKTLEFKTLRNIKEGEEITVNYNRGEPDNKDQLWKDIPPYEES